MHTLIKSQIWPVAAIILLMMLAMYMMPSLSLAQDSFILISDPLIPGRDVNVLGLCEGATAGQTVNISLISSAGITFLTAGNITNSVGNFNEHIMVPDLSGDLSVQAVCPDGTVLIFPPAILPSATPPAVEPAVLGESIPVPEGGVAAGTGPGSQASPLLGLGLMALAVLVSVASAKLKTNA